MESDASINVQTAVKRKKTGGKPPRITEEIVDRIACKVSKGVPLRYALAGETQAIPMVHWQKSLQDHPPLALRFDQKMAAWIEAAMDKINGASCRTLPGECWTLERRFAEYFSTKQPVVNVAVNQIGGVPLEVAKRAAQLLRLRHGARQLTDS